MKENNESQLENRMYKMERRFDELIQALYRNENMPEEQKEFDMGRFAKVYNHARYKLPLMKIIPVAICINDKYRESALKHFYPSDIEGYYYPLGELSPLNISFKKDLVTDYYVQCAIEGDF